MTKTTTTRSSWTLFLLGLAITSALTVACAGDRGRAEPAESHTELQSTSIVGKFVYLADAAMFVECETGKRAPVAMEADYISLEKAYLEARGEPGEAILVTIEGRYDPRPAADDEEGAREFLIVERFDQIRPGEDCDSSVNPGAD